MRTKDSIDNCVCFQDYIVELEVAHEEIKRLRKALATYSCRCGDGDCYVEEFVPSCGRSAREALGLILDANSLPYAQEIAAKALEEKK